MEQSKTYVEFLYPGMLFTETDEKQVANRNIQTLKIPTQAFGFLFFDKTIKTIELDGKKTVVNGKRRNVSGIYYPNGKVFSLDEVRRTISSDTWHSQETIYFSKRLVST